MRILCLLCFRKCHPQDVFSCPSCTQAAALLAWNQAGWHSVFPASPAQPHTISSPALLRVWQWHLSGAGALLVHSQCSLRQKGVKWSRWQLGGLCGPLSARTSLSTNTKMLLTDNFHKLLCWVSASLHSTLSHASADTCGRTCRRSMACLSVAFSSFSS